MSTLDQNHFPLKCDVKSKNDKYILSYKFLILQIMKKMINPSYFLILIKAIAFPAIPTNQIAFKEVLFGTLQILFW